MIRQCILLICSLPFAFSVCTSTYTQTHYTSWAGASGDNALLQCGYGCFVTSVTTYYGGNIDKIKVTCNDGGTSGPQGCADCSSEPTVTATNAPGFTGMGVWAASNVNGLSIIKRGGTEVNAGGSNCGLSNPGCSGGRQGLTCNAGSYMTGIEIRTGQSSYNSFLNAIRGLCAVIQCPDGTYFASDSTCAACTSCPLGQYVSGCGGTQGPGSCVACSSCGAGQYTVSCSGIQGPGACSTCTSCGVGQYTSGCSGMSGPGSCSSCTSCTATGQYTNGCGGVTGPGSCASCTNLPGNNYFTSSGGMSDSCAYAPCVSCGVGTVQTGCSTLSPGSCTACTTSPPVGQYWNTPGSCAFSPCVNWCNVQIGQYSTCGGVSAGTCQQCTNALSAASYYTLDGGFSASCVLGSPPPGSYRNLADRRVTYTGGLWYLPCPVGTYADVAGLTACKSCASGSVSSNTGQTICQVCPAGKYSASSSACVSCLAGTYTPGSGYSACLSCTQGTNFAAAQGSLACSACSVVNCGLGYLTVACTTTSDAYCSACSSILACYYTTLNKCTNADGSAACFCLPGYYFYYRTPTTSCLPCPSATYKAGNNSATACTAWTVAACNVGYYRAQGTPFQDSQCVACSQLPQNTVAQSSGCAWKCQGGFKPS